MPRVFAVQFDIVWEEKAANHAQVEAMLAGEQPEPGSLIVLPELFDVGFSLNTAAMAEQATGGASEAWCGALARRLKCYVQGASIQRPDANRKAFNTAVVFDPRGECVCRYEKIHPFSGGREGEAYQGGSRIAVFEWHGLRVCPLICYDLRFPELWRLAVLDHGAQMFTIGASWPAMRQHHWTTLLSARAIENQAYVVGVNRSGKDPFLPYSGGSRIIDPKGTVLAEAGESPAALRADVDVLEVEAWRHAVGALRDAHREFLGRV